MAATLTKDEAIETIELLPNNQVMFVCDSETVAKKLLRRNPRGSLAKGADDTDERVVLVYDLDQTNLLNAIKRGWLTSHLLLNAERQRFANA